MSLTTGTVARWVQTWVSAGSLAERHDACQHRAARARYPDAFTLVTVIQQLAAAAVPLEEGREGMQQQGHDV